MRFIIQCLRYRIHQTSKDRKTRKSVHIPKEMSLTKEFKNKRFDLTINLLFNHFVPM